jgi:hypothetical protein
LLCFAGLLIQAGIGIGLSPVSETIVATNPVLSQLQVTAVGIEGRLTEITAKVDLLVTKAMASESGKFGDDGTIGSDPFQGEVLVNTVERLVNEHLQLTQVIKADRRFHSFCAGMGGG